MRQMRLMQSNLFDTPMAEMLTGALPAQAPAETNGLAFFAASRVVRLLDSLH